MVSIELSLFVYKCTRATSSEISSETLLRFRLSCSFCEVFSELLGDFLSGSEFAGMYIMHRLAYNFSLHSPSTVRIWTYIDLPSSGRAAYAPVYSLPNPRSTASRHQFITKRNCIATCKMFSRSTLVTTRNGTRAKSVGHVIKL